MSLIIEPSHWDYLKIQHGSIASEENLADFAKWQAAYEASLANLLANIEPALPKECGSILDIGSGLGGVDILLGRHYGGATVGLLDGIDCPPHTHAANIPFSNAAVATDFHHKNGSKFVRCYWPAPPPAEHFDLIVSFAAYCFHIAPFEYMPVLMNNVRSHTVLIFDVRKKKEWLAPLVTAFGQPKVLYSAEKFIRCAFRGK